LAAEFIGAITSGERGSRWELGLQIIGRGKGGVPAQGGPMDTTKHKTEKQRSLGRKGKNTCVVSMSERKAFRSGVLHTT